MNKVKRSYWWIAGFLLAVMVALLSPLASRHPDGLERVTDDHGVSSHAVASPFEVIPNYLFPGVKNEAVAKMLSGLIGTIALFGIGFGVSRLIRRRSRGTGHGQGASRGEGA